MLLVITVGPCSCLLLLLLLLPCCCSPAPGPQHVQGLQGHGTGSQAQGGRCHQRSSQLPLGQPLTAVHCSRHPVRAHPDQGMALVSHTHMHMHSLGCCTQTSVHCSGPNGMVGCSMKPTVHRTASHDTCRLPSHATAAHHLCSCIMIYRHHALPHAELLCYVSGYSVNLWCMLAAVIRGELATM
jgi:hypothetical protein